MATFEVEVSRTITATVKVDADSAEAAMEQVNRKDFPLPPRDEWAGSKDWRYVVFDHAGNELLDSD